jgi:hypothetical protein
MRSIRHEAVLAAVKTGLSRSLEGFGHLLKYSTQEQTQGAKLVIELGVLKAGPVLDLCSISMGCKSISNIPLGTWLRTRCFKERQSSTAFRHWITSVSTPARGTAGVDENQGCTRRLPV